MSDSSLTLSSIAILRVDIDKNHRDYLDYLAPFVLEVLQGKTKNAVADVDVCKDIFDRFGLVIPAPVIQLVLKRFAKKRYLSKSHGVFHISENLPKSEMAEKQKTSMDSISRVIEGLVKYAKQEFGKFLSTDAASSALLAILKVFGVDLISAFKKNTAIPDATIREHGTEFITWSYIDYIYKNDTSAFQELIILVKGVLLSNALLCPDLQSIQKNFKAVTFYLDTPLILNIIGLHGERSRNLTIELVELVHHLQGSIAFFSHTARETEAVIKAAIDQFDNPGFKMRIVDTMRREGGTKSDLILLRDDLVGKIENMRLGIKIVDTPSNLQDYEVIDEIQLEEAVSREITYMNPRALEFDLNSIRAVYALRTGRIPTQLEETKAITVTSNSALARAAAFYGKQHEYAREVSPAITDFSLSSVAWLKAPMGAPSLPETELLAICYSALEPDEELWNAYVNEINGLRNKGKISADDHAILRSSEIAQSELMKLTMGDEDAFGMDTIMQVLERVKIELSAEEAIKLAEEATKLAKEKADHKTTEAEKNSLEIKTKKAETSLFWRARRNAKGLSSSLIAVLISLLGFGLYLLSPFSGGFGQFQGSWSWVTQGLAVLVIAFGLLNWIFGWNVSKFNYAIWTRLENVLFRKYYSETFGVEPPEKIS